jgi:hypothetical protein
MTSQDKSSQEDIFRKQILDPLSEGELFQVEKIRKLSEDPEDILIFKQELVDLKSKMIKESPAFALSQNLAEVDKLAPADIQHPRPHPKKRKTDDKVFIKTKPGFFQVLLNIFSLLSQFRNKYRKQRKVRFSILNFLKNSSFFFIDDSVIFFAEKEILPLLNLLHPFVRAIYEWGWCDAKGKRILIPLDFNLISNFERFINKRSLEQFFHFPRNPAKSMVALNGFIHYYYELIHDQVHFERLMLNIKKILFLMVDNKSENISMETVKTILKMIMEFSKMNLERNFLIPVFESFVGHPVLNSETKSLIKITPISISEYYADSRLSSIMKAKEEQYKKYIESKLAKSKELLNLIQNAKRDLDYKIEHSKGHFLSLIEHAVFKKYSIYKGFPNFEDLLPHQKCFFAALYFIETYEGFLTSAMKVKKDITREDIIEARIFELSVFKHELEFIFGALNKLRHIAEKGFTGDIFSHLSKDGELTNEMKIHLSNLDSVADMFFFLGYKIYRYFKGNLKKKEEAQPLNADEMGSMLSFYDQYVIFQISTKKDFNEGYYFFQKKISDILMEIKAFCFQYVYHFENQYRKFQGDSDRSKTLKAMISEISLLEKKIKTLENGDDAEL